MAAGHAVRETTGRDEDRLCVLGAAPMSGIANPGLIEQLDADVHARLAEPGRRGQPTQDIQGDGPLPGVRVATKDLYRVDGFETRAGSRLPAAVFAGPESAVVTRLRATGVSIIGNPAIA
jgi:Asp-tRNA(Asn)/Glu-tRNA(Gln) amidotransferase A subunit family amidase